MKEKGEKEQVTKRKCYKEGGAEDWRGEKKDKQRNKQVSKNQGQRKEEVIRKRVR